MKSFSGKILKCLYCSKECKIPNHRKNSFKYCSRKCGALYVRISIKKNCKICDKEFEHISSRANSAKYCSKKCYYKSQVKRGKTPFKCFHCQKEFFDSKSANRKYCSRACVNKVEKKIYIESYPTVRKKMKKYGLIEKCAHCGYDEIPRILGVHHIDKNTKNNSRENLIVLCPNCHSIAHCKHIIHT